MGNRKQIESTVDDVRLLNFNVNNSTMGSLIAIEQSNNIPFDLKRVFFVYGVPAGITRGNHAHIEQSQVLVSLNGECKVSVKDGNLERKFVLDGPSSGLFIPPGIWDEVTYCDNSILLVLADDCYNPDDYIDNWDNFLRFKRENNI